MPEQRRHATPSAGRARESKVPAAEVGSSATSRGEAAERWLLGQAEALARGLAAGDPRASEHLARLVVADSRGALRPFARMLATCLSDHVWHWAERGVTDPQITIGSDLQSRLREAAARMLAGPLEGRSRDDA